MPLVFVTERRDQTYEDRCYKKGIHNLTVAAVEISLFLYLRGLLVHKKIAMRALT